jgi:phytoene synthase
MQVSDTITRKSASNLALAFILLPKKKRAGMCTLYAFCREVDDVADNESVPVQARRLALAEWRKDLLLAYDGKTPNFPVNRELGEAINTYRLPFELFDELLKGVEMDLENQRYQTYQDLERYCYRVASVVGLLSIEIFGYSDPRCRDYAVQLGQALQLTNILRDVRTDASRGRIYLPLSELERFSVTEEEILSGKYSERFERLAQAVADRAKNFYTGARSALPPIDRRSMSTAELMGSVYWGLLRKLELRRFNVFDHEETRLNKAQKAFLIFRTWYRSSIGAPVPNYGIA